MTEVLFYHLDRMPLERVLPELLERCLERKWCAVVQTGSEERCAALDAHLWTYREDSFLPHGSAEAGSAAGEGDGQRQPVWLTCGDENPNKAEVRFLTDGAETANMAGYQRIVMLFDGHDNDAVDRARSVWKSARAEGHETTYWQQDERGRWKQKA